VLRERQRSHIRLPYDWFRQRGSRLVSPAQRSLDLECVPHVRAVPVLLPERRSDTGLESTVSRQASQPRDAFSRSPRRGLPGDSLLASGLVRCSSHCLRLATAFGLRWCLIGASGLYSTMDQDRWAGIAVAKWLLVNERACPVPNRIPSRLLPCRKSINCRSKCRCSSRAELSLSRKQRCGHI
jgi:hypothetical protein